MKCKEVGTTQSVEDIAFALGWGRGGRNIAVALIHI